MKIMKPFVSLILCVLSTSIASANSLDWATGAWGIEIDNIPEGLDPRAIDTLRNCMDTPVYITVNKETLRYKAVHTGENNFETHSPILEHTHKTLTLQYDNEARLMKNGEPHIWHMVFVNEDKFYWVLGTGIGKDERDGMIPVARVRCQTLTS